MHVHKIKEIPKSEIIHYLSNYDIISSKFNKVKVKYKSYDINLSLPIDAIESFFGLFRLSRRALRLDKCNVFVADEKLIIIRRGKVYSYDLENQELIETLQLKNCRNILHQSLCQNSEGDLFFGEYGNNGDRKSVNIYKSSDKGLSWEVIYQFKAGEIKHIHGCYYDPYEDKIWTLTGDFEGENIIMKSNSDFTVNEKIGDGSQKYRAVNILFQPDTVHWIMDSPVEISYHYQMDRNTYKLFKKTSFPGPVWYLKELSDGYYLAATSVEIGNGVLDNHANLFLSKNLDTWKKIGNFKKDFLPMRFFKWGVIAFADGIQSSNAFALHFEALKKVDGKSYICKLEDDKR